jgi:hypothetical protein
MIVQPNIHPVLKISNDVGELERYLRHASELFAKRNLKQSPRPPARQKNRRSPRSAQRRSGNAA